MPVRPRRVAPSPSRSHLLFNFVGRWWVVKKTFVRVLVTFVVASTLVLIPATSAQAFDAGPLLKSTVKAAPTVGKGVSLFGRFSNPYGWAITAAQVGWFAWGQRDAFIGTDQPERSLNDYGEFDPEFTATPASAGLYGESADSSFRITSATTTTLSYEFKCVSTVLNSYSCASPDWTVATAWVAGDNGSGSPDWVEKEWAWCRGSDGVINQRRPKYKGLSARTPDSMTVIGTYSPCPVGEELTGLFITAGTSGVRQKYPIAYGSAVPASYGDNPVALDEYAVAVECVNYSTLEVATITASTPAGEGGFVLPSCGGRLGEDWHAKGFVVTPTKPEIDNEPIPMEVPVPDFLPLEWDELLPADPDWQPCQSSKNGCSLSVWIDTKRCYEGVAGCADWEEIERAEPERIKCRWGVNDVALSNCRVLRDLYKPLTEVEVDTGLKTEPGTGADTSSGTSPGVAVGALPRPENEAEGAECMPSGWGAFNPIEWVLKPVKCALTWAFVPHPADWGWSDLVEQAETRPPVSIGVGIASAASAMASAYQGSGDCGILADFRSSDMPNAAVTCAQVKSVPGFGGFYALVQAALFALTGLGVWKMFSGVLEDGQ